MGLSSQKIKPVLLKRLVPRIVINLKCFINLKKKYYNAMRRTLLYTSID